MAINILIFPIYSLKSPYKNYFSRWMSPSHQYFRQIVGVVWVRSLVSSYPYEIFTHKVHIWITCESYMNHMWFWALHIWFWPFHIWFTYELIISPVKFYVKKSHMWIIYETDVILGTSHVILSISYMFHIWKVNFTYDFMCENAQSVTTNDNYK